MRIVQTFWTGGLSPLHCGFGWMHPQYNLMSWAVSCLSLRALYDDVALYTDAEGYEMLIEKLRLPYTEVHVCYDKDLCLPLHWAYSKIKTYSLQTEPFLHVDGDVFLPKPIPAEVWAHPLVAQNKEVGTDYYKDMMQRVLHNPNIAIPDCIREVLREDALASYNMGVFGGSDLDFIQRYCNEVFRFVESNHLNERENPNSRVECNIFFEQIILAAMADLAHIPVGSVVDHEMFDQGYTVSEFCSLDRYGERPMYHLLGGHKRNPYVLRMLPRMLMRTWPEYFRRIVEIFPHPHKTREINPNVAHYTAFLNTKREEWAKIPQEEMMKTEEETAYNNLFLNAGEKERKEFLLKCAPHLTIYTIPEEEDKRTKEKHFKRLDCGLHYPLHEIAVIPTMTGKGYCEKAILDVEGEIFKIAGKEGMKLPNLIEELFNRTESIDFYKKYFLKTLKKLVKYGYIIAAR